MAPSSKHGDGPAVGPAAAPGTAPKTAPRPRVVLLGDGVVQLDYGDITAVTLEMAKYTFRVRQELTGGEAVAILFSGNRLLHFDRDAAEFAASPTVARTILAAAIAPHGALVRNLARLFIWYHRPPYPVRVFGSEADALVWLRERAR